jgi:hypothetical protein
MEELELAPELELGLVLPGSSVDGTEETGAS